MTKEEQEKYLREATAKVLLETGNMSLTELMKWLSVDRDGYQEIEI